MLYVCLGWAMVPHDPVVHMLGMRRCPLCVALEELQIAEKKAETLEREVDDLERKLADYHRGTEGPRL